MARINVFEGTQPTLTQVPPRVPVADERDPCAELGAANGGGEAGRAGADHRKVEFLFARLVEH